MYTENGTNRKWQFPFVCCKRIAEVCIPWLANNKTVIDVCCFFRHVHLCMKTYVVMVMNVDVNVDTVMDIDTDIDMDMAVDMNVDMALKRKFKMEV
jgi:hypothetical protein